MHKLVTPFTLYNKQYKKTFLFVYTNLQGDFIDENKVVHNKRALVSPVSVVVQAEEKRHS
jgi:hypothetical protein